MVVDNAARLLSVLLQESDPLFRKHDSLYNEPISSSISVADNLLDLLMFVIAGDYVITMGCNNEQSHATTR